MDSDNTNTEIWRHLKRVAIPKFNGDKTKYAHWEAAFDACVDKAPVSKEYKLLQLREFLEGDALKTIEHLGYSGSAYDMAKDRLRNKYGGVRRQVLIHLEKIDRFRQISNCAKDLEEPLEFDVE